MLPARALRAASGAMLVAVLNGCAAQSPSDPADNYVGRPVEEMITAYGPPTTRRRGEAGADEVIWQYRGDRLEFGRQEPPTVAASRSGSPIVVPGRRPAPKLVPSRCQLVAELDSESRVRALRASGDACFEVLNSPALWRKSPRS